MTALPLIESLLASDPRGGPHLVFDIDNTVADTRFRTLHVARAFDAALGTRHFTALGLEHVRLDGTATARAHGLDADVAAAFQAYWASDQGFWCGQCFAEDRPLRPVVDLARRGHAQGTKACVGHRVVDVEHEMRATARVGCE